MDLTRPQYIQNYEPINYFEEFENNSNSWIKLYYYIEIPFFKSALGTGKKLRNITALNNCSIFNPYDKIDFDKYFLKEETKEVCGIPNTYLVSEVYGYAPDFTYTDYTSQTITRCGWEDPAGALTATITSITYDYTESTYNIVLSEENANLLRIGDTIKIAGNEYKLYDNSGVSFKEDVIVPSYGLGQGYKAGYYYYATFSTSALPITEIDGTTVKVQAQDATVPSGKILGNDNTSYYTWETHNATPERVVWQIGEVGGTISRGYSSKVPESRTTTVRTYTSFLDKAPDILEQKFTPVDGQGLETDTIKSTTVPNITLWKKIIAGTATENEIASLNGITNDGYMLVEDAILERFHGIYKKTLKYTKCI